MTPEPGKPAQMDLDADQAIADLDQAIADRQQYALNIELARTMPHPRLLQRVKDHRIRHMSNSGKIHSCAPLKSHKTPEMTTRICWTSTKRPWTPSPQLVRSATRPASGRLQPPADLRRRCVAPRPHNAVPRSLRNVPTRRSRRS